MRGGFVGVAVEEAAVVMPIADASVGLPGVGIDAGGAAAFDVEDHGSGVFGDEVLGVEYGFELAVGFDVGVVVMGGDVEAGLAKGEF